MTFVILLAVWVVIGGRDWFAISHAGNLNLEGTPSLRGCCRLRRGGYRGGYYRDN